MTGKVRTLLLGDTLTETDVVEESSGGWSRLRFRVRPHLRAELEKRLGDADPRRGARCVPVPDADGGRWAVTSFRLTPETGDGLRLRCDLEVLPAGGPPRPPEPPPDTGGTRAAPRAAVIDELLTGRLLTDEPAPGPAGAGPAAFGEALDLGGVVVTVTDVRESDAPHGLLDRGSGRTPLAFTVVVRNEGGDRLDLGSVRASVRTGPQGRSAKSAWSGGLAFEGSLLPGRSASSEAVYLAEPGTTALVDVDIEIRRYSGDSPVGSWSGPAEPLPGAAAPERPTPGRRAELLAEAMADLSAMVGLEPMKRQVRVLVAQLRMARLREERGLPGGAVPHHMVFSGPPGTGKTTVARILGKVFAGLGLLERGHLVEAHRADLVAGYVGQTAPKTNRVVDRALDGVLFVDEAYALSNTRGGGNDRDAFGDEALQVLLTRAENDRHRLVVVLAGYPGEIAELLASNPGLNSRFDTRVDFPGFTAAELAEIMRGLFTTGGEIAGPGAGEVVERCCALATERGWTDELGNGRFVRSLYERARALRDYRLAEEAADPAALADDALLTVRAEDLVEAFAEIAGRLAPEEDLAEAVRKRR